MLELDGVDYFDDRMFLCWIGRCFLGPDEDGISFSTIFHEEPQRSALQDELDLWVVLLTNRVHPTRENQKHVPLRRAVHDAAVLAITDRSIQQRQP